MGSKAFIVIIFTLILPPPSEASVVRESMKFTMTDDTEIDGAYYFPENAHKHPKHPAIILATSWLMSKYEYEMQARKLAKRGYIVLNYSARGFGRSGGKVRIASEDDIGDVSTLIDHLQNKFDTGKIGIAGISYGGGIGLLASAFDKRIRAVACLSGWTDLNATLYRGKTVNRTWSFFLMRSGQVFGRIHPETLTIYQNLINRENIDWTIKWAANRSANNYMEAFNQNQPAIYISSNINDNLFDPAHNLKFYHAYQGPKAMDINNGIHASAELMGLAGISNYVWTRLHNHFDFHLKGKGEPLVSTHIVDNTDKREAFTAETNKLQKTLFLSKVDGKLLLGPTKSQESSWVPYSAKKDTTATTGLPLIGTLRSAHSNGTYANLNRINSRYGLVFQGDPVEQTMRIRGTPKIQLKVKAEQAPLLVIAYLYDVPSKGKSRLIAHGPQTVWRNTPNQTYTVDIELFNSNYDLPKGHRIAVVVDSRDPLYQPIRQDKTIQIGVGPHLSSITIPHIKNQTL